MNNEIWEPIKGYEGLYEVSNFGNVKSLDKYWIATHGNTNVMRGKILKGFISKCGYKLICLTINGNRSTKLIHRLVAAIFIPNPQNKPEINHIDGNKLNNHSINLEWNTRSENIRHALKNGLHKGIGETHKDAILNNVQVLEIFNSDKDNHALAIIYKVNSYVISNIKRGITWTHITHKQYERVMMTKQKAIEIFNCNKEIKEISDIFNTSEAYIKRIKNGTRWNCIQANN